mmetsp:Transcript_17149/g.25714  ORF Transcript_17149/g.25714 Transcript_17149/m.25714 type:complete len:474 (-) Transcript_17149:156-1577(-)
MSKALPFLSPDDFIKLRENSDAKSLNSITYKLSTLQKIFVTLEDPSSCVLGKIISIFVIIVIFLSGFVFIISTDPSIKTQPSSCDHPACDDDPQLCPGYKICEPTLPMWLFYVETFCVVVFSIDYGTRISLVTSVPSRLSRVFNVEQWDNEKDPAEPDPSYSPLVTTWRYMTRPMNIIDLISILPFFVTFATPQGGSLTIFRILRLGRILRVTKAGRNNTSMEVMVTSIKNSGEILGTLMFYILLCLIVVAALVFQFEEGDFTVNSNYPEGAYLRPTVDLQGKEPSPYVSVWVAIYWAVVTGTTLGYGDLFPTTIMGRLISCFWIFCGILVLGLPIGIIGSNFTVELEKQKELEKQRKAAIAMLRQDSIGNSMNPMHNASGKTSTSKSADKTSAIAEEKKEKEVMDDGFGFEIPVVRRPLVSTAEASTQTDLEVVPSNAEIKSDGIATDNVTLQEQLVLLDRLRTSLLRETSG